MEKVLKTPLTIDTSAPASVLDLLQIIDEKEHLIADHEALIAAQQKQLELLEEALRLAWIGRFGRSSEKLPFQGELFDEAELEVSLEAQLPQVGLAEKSVYSPPVFTIGRFPNIH